MHDIQRRYTFFIVIKSAKTFVEIEAMTENELKQTDEEMKSTALSAASTNRASSLQSFENSPEYAHPFQSRQHEHTRSIITISGTAFQF